MKSPFKTLLETALIASLVLSAVFLVQYFFRSKQLRSATVTFQAEAARAQQIQAVGMTLAQQAHGFREKDKSIDPVLQSLGLLPAPTNAPAN
ncbi:MAG TPA: hypothetical protein GYA07_12940 [Verrucomicrobia bacterium]|nr:hypothetical protein [Verrucomicrobiota bacterium]HOB31424.1 hypothetical protein [Verrucomicrobiota bacterium]HOP97424.1 hypothetical protein [Verrucomicrobiota bacterium]HPU54683.1 hypothetical protein [Verrucomicrobiota bacterium]